jgi:hypothetical protein
MLHYHCYRHIIEKFGARNPLGLLIRRILFLPTEAEFDFAIPQILSDITIILQKKLTAFRDAKISLFYWINY